MHIRFFLPKSIYTLGLLGILGLGSANPVLSASLVLDSFDAPNPKEFTVITTTGDIDEIQTSSPTVLGGIREAFLHVYHNPLNSASVMQVGDGNLSVAQGTGAVAETVITYGAFTRPTGDPTVAGPLLRLDLSDFNALKFDFSGAEDVLNVNVEFYTATPLDPLHPLYYSLSGINIAPAVSGDPLSFTLGVSNSAAFNWSLVDGIRVLLNRSGPTPSTSYTLDQLTFETSPVPEPQTWVLLLAGLSALLIFRYRDS